VAEELFETTKGVVEETWPTFKRWLKYLLLSGWSVLWLLVLGIGWLVGSSTVMLVPGVVLGLTAVTVGYRSYAHKKRLESRARASLVARSQLNRLRLDRPMQAALSAFDHHYGRVQKQLAVPDLAEIDTGLKIEADIERARDHLYDLAETESRLREELASLKGARNVPSVSAAREEIRAQIVTVQKQGDKVALDVQKLSERLSTLRFLSSGSEPDAKQRTLEDVMEDLDRTAAAYQEIEEDRLAKMRARAAQLAGAARKA
jgi:hypothetical protein